MPWHLWRNGMKTEVEIRVAGMPALIGALGLIEAERFLMAVSRERFDYTEWCRHGLPDLSLDELARLANLEAEKIRVSQVETSQVYA
jgi:hypothetical protein